MLRIVGRLSICSVLLIGLAGCAEQSWSSWLPWNWKKSPAATTAQADTRNLKPGPAIRRAPYELIPPSLGLTQLHCAELLRVVRSFSQMKPAGQLDSAYRFGLAFGYAIGFVSGADATHDGEVEIPSGNEYVNFARDVATQCTQRPDMNLQMAVVQKFETSWISKYYQSNQASVPQDGATVVPAQQQQQQRRTAPGNSAGTPVSQAAPRAPVDRYAQGSWRSQSSAQFWPQSR